MRQPLYAVAFVITLLLCVLPLAIWVINGFAINNWPSVLGAAGIAVWCGAWGWISYRAFVASQREPRRLSPPPLALACVSCGECDVVRGPVRPWRWRDRGEARCLTCGHRWAVHSRCWRQLPLPNRGDPYETEADLRMLMMHVPVTAWNLTAIAACTGVAIMIALVLSSWIERFLPRVSGFHLALVALGVPLGYVFRRVLQAPPRPGRRCVRCRYDLSRSTGAVCPECGAATNASEPRP